GKVELFYYGWCVWFDSGLTRPNVKKCGKRPFLQGFSGKVLDEWFYLAETERLLLRNHTAHTMCKASKQVWDSIAAEQRSRAMVTLKSSQKIFTDSEVANLTGICVEHVHNFAKRRHLGFTARAAEAAGITADQWLFTLSDLMVLVTLFPKCTH